MIKIVQRFFLNKVFVFTAIVIIQLAFSLYKISTHSLWYDECFTINTAIKNVPDIIAVSKNDVNPPLYPIIVHFWVKLFGISEFSVRFLSALAAAFAAGFLYLLSAKFLNKQAAVFAVLMFITSNDFYYYSQEARTYALILLFVVLSNYCYLSLFYENRSRRRILFAILLGLFNAGLFYLHFLSCFNIIAQCICLPLFLWQTNKNFALEKTPDQNIKHYIVAYFLSVGVLLIFLVPFTNRFISLVKGSVNGSKMWLQKPTVLDLKNCVYELFNTKEVYQVYIYTLILIVFLVFIKKFKSTSTIYIIFFLVSGPCMFLLNYYIASYSPIFLSRYVLFTYLGFILLFSYLLSLIEIHIALKTIVMLSIALFAYTKMIIPRYTNQDYKNAVKFFKTIQNDSTLITTDLQDIVSYYYDKDIFCITNDSLKSKKLLEKGIFHQLYDLTWPERLDLSKYKDIYYTQSYEFLNDGAKTVATQLNNKFTFVGKNENFWGVNIMHYRNEHYKANSK